MSDVYHILKEVPQPNDPPKQCYHDDTTRTASHSEVKQTKFSLQTQQIKNELTPMLPLENEINKLVRLLTVSHNVLLHVEPTESSNSYSVTFRDFEPREEPAFTILDKPIAVAHPEPPNKLRLDIPADASGLFYLWESINQHVPRDKVTISDEVLFGTLSVELEEYIDETVMLAAEECSFTVDKSAIKGLRAAEKELSQQLKLAIDWADFILKKVQDTKTPRDQELAMGAAYFVVENCGIWDEKQVQQTLRTCMFFKDLEPLATEFPRFFRPSHWP